MPVLETVCFDDSVRVLAASRADNSQGWMTERVCGIDDGDSAGIETDVS
jgi:hypothetical protein